MVQLSKKIGMHLKVKYDDNLEKNDYDQLYVDRMLTFRNLQVKDQNFNKKKEKVLWPLLEFKSSTGRDQIDLNKPNKD